MQPRFVQVPEDIHLLDGASGKLVCDVTSFFQPEITWTFNGRPIMHERFETADNGHLLLHRIREQDAGNYRCTASSFVAEITADAQVQVFSKFIYKVLLYN